MLSFPSGSGPKIRFSHCTSFEAESVTAPNSGEEIDLGDNGGSGRGCRRTGSAVIRER